MTTFVEELCSSADDPSKKARRIAGLMQGAGLSRTEAMIVDEAFLTAANGAIRGIAEELDGLAAPLQTLALGYVLDGVTANLQGLQEQVLSLALEAALSQGRVIAVAGGKPECDCPVCAMARLTAEAAGQRRH